MGLDFAVVGFAALPEWVLNYEVSSLCLLLMMSVWDSCECVLVVAVESGGSFLD